MEPDLDPYADAVYTHADDSEGSQSGEESQADDELDEYDPLAPVGPASQGRADNQDMPRDWPAPQSMLPFGKDVPSSVQQAHSSTLRQATNQHVTFSEPQLMNVSGDDGIRPQALTSLSHTLRTTEQSSSQSAVNTASLFADMQMQSFTDSVAGESSAPRAMMSGQDEYSNRLPRDLPVPQEMNSSSDDGSHRSRGYKPTYVDDGEASEHTWSGAASYCSSMAGKAPSLPTIDEESGESDSNDSDESHKGSVFSSPMSVQDAANHGSPLQPAGDESAQCLNLPPVIQYKDIHGVQNAVACLTGSKDQLLTETSAGESGDGTSGDARATLSGCLSLASLQNFVHLKEQQIGSVHRLLQTHDVPAGPALARSETGRSAERHSSRCVMLPFPAHMVCAQSTVIATYFKLY